MDFLEGLYEIENFGIYLFVVIGLLIMAFLFVLFFGKKDAKKQESKDLVNKEEMALPQDVPVKTEETVIPVPVEANINVEENHAVITNQVLNGNDEEKEHESEVVQEKEFDFDALAAAISKELESIDKQPSEEAPRPVIEEKEDDLSHLFEPVKVEDTIPVNVENKVEAEKEVPKVEEEREKPRPVMREVFSSVYVNREKETPKTEEKIEPVGRGFNPSMDLPKKIELPKRAE